MDGWQYTEVNTEIFWNHKVFYTYKNAWFGQSAKLSCRKIKLFYSIVTSGGFCSR